MIVQCEACQTRFRLADEKIKPGGTKVRCSKCKVVFTVTPPEPEPAEETVDFDSFNMEKVAEDVPAESAPSVESLQTDASEPEEQPALPSEPEPEPEPDNGTEATEQPESNDLDFSSLESEMESNVGLNDELADEFTFADTSQAVADDAVEEDTPSSDSSISLDNGTEEEQAEGEATDFGAAFEETEEPGGPVDFDFSEDSESDTESTESTKIDFSTEETTEPSEFSFDSSEEEPKEQEAPGEFSFEEEGDDTAFSFDDAEEESTPAASEEYSEPGEFSFDDESPSSEDSASEWGDESSGDDTSFNFEEPNFDTDDSPAESSASSSEEGLQFGEIDFSNDSDEGEAPGFQSDDDFSKASMELKDEPEPLRPSQQSSHSPSRSNDDDEQLPAPPPPKKSSLSRILVLLVLLLVILGGAAGFLFMQEGSLNLNTVVQYLPFLQDYIGEAPATSPGDRIGINIEGSSYVSGQAGQMLVIQGAAVNNHPTTRSAITVKGVLLDDKGKSLLQQTVFCGNKLEATALQSMPFAAIEEAMNNQFGDGLSNMNVGAGTTIPFTIVFRNLPAGVANINVEVVDSKPGAG